MTTAERFQQVERVYLAALACEPSRRAALLDRECAGDAALRHEAESLLAQEPRVGSFLEDQRWLEGRSQDHPARPAESGASPRDQDGDGEPDAGNAAGGYDDPPPPVDHAGLFAGRYRIVRPLGRGGMAVVYQAEDVRLKRFVALKFLGASLSAQPQARVRFLHEAQAAAALDDPHVCTVYEAGEEHGRAYLAMAFIDGPTLRDRIADGPLTIEDVLAIAGDVAAGLAAAHARGVVHRDIKPGNVLLAGRLAKIADFGVARIAGAARPTATVGVLGTPAYMSPEQVQGLPADHRSDIWSLGCVIYEMLSGRSPFATAGGRTDVFAIVHGPAPDVAALRPDVPASLAAIVARCLEPDLGDRYQDAASLLADLEAVKVGGPGVAARPAPREEAPSIAVLPFADMSADRAQEYFAEGIAEEIIHALTRAEGLRVVARTSSFAAAGKGLDVREVGRVLNVDSVLEGSVRVSGSRVRITAQLIGVEDGFHVWSERFDREAGDVFAVQDEIAAAIVGRLSTALRLPERAPAARRGRVDPKVYTLYLEGRYFANRPSPENVERALRLFGEAASLDPGFAPAPAATASLWADMGTLHLAHLDEAWPMARAAAERALALDPDVADAHVALGALALWYEWDWTAAEARMKRVLALHPGDAAARSRYAWMLLIRRRHDEACAAARQALAADPLSPLLCGLCVGLLAACGRGEEAIATFRRGVELAPAVGLPYFHAAIACLSLGRFEEVAGLLDQGTRHGAVIPWADVVLALARAKQGRRDEAQDLLARLVERHARQEMSGAPIAWVAASLDDFDMAFEWLDRAFVERDGLLPTVHVYTEVFVPGLARDPRFRSLLERLRLTGVGSN